MTIFDKYLQSGDPLVQQAAQLLDEATTKFKAGQMSEAEYKEVAQDILTLILFLLQ